MKCIERYGPSIGGDPGLLYRPPSILTESSIHDTKGKSKLTEHANVRRKVDNGSIGGCMEHSNLSVCLFRTLQAIQSETVVALETFLLRKLPYILFMTFDNSQAQVFAGVPAFWGSTEAFLRVSDHFRAGRENEACIV